VKTGLSVSATVGIEGETKRSGFVAYPLRGCADFKDTQPVENRSLNATTSYREKAHGACRL